MAGNSAEAAASGEDSGSVQADQRSAHARSAFEGDRARRRRRARPVRGETCGAPRGGSLSRTTGPDSSAPQALRQHAHFARASAAEPHQGRPSRPPHLDVLHARPFSRPHCSSMRRSLRALPLRRRALIAPPSRRRAPPSPPRRGSTQTPCRVRRNRCPCRSRRRARESAASASRTGFGVSVAAIAGVAQNAAASVPCCAATAPRRAARGGARDTTSARRKIGASARIEGERPPSARGTA